MANIDMDILLVNRRGKYYKVCSNRDINQIALDNCVNDLASTILVERAKCLVCCHIPCAGPRMQRVHRDTLTAFQQAVSVNTAVHHVTPVNTDM